MRSLPPLTLGPSRHFFPMADRSAAALVEAILCRDAAPEAASAATAAALSTDPPLTLWALLTASKEGREAPDSIAALAAWLEANVLRILEWSEAASPGVDWGQREDSFADQVLADVELAKAVAPQSQEGDEPSNPLRLAAFARRAREWLRLTAASADEGEAWDRAAAGLECLTGPAAASLDSAEQALRQDSNRKARDSSLDAARRRWLEPCSLAAALPALTARLAHLEALEGRFQQTLQQEKLDAMAELAAGAGHEINNPLAIIAGRAQLLLKGETDPERRLELATINTQAKRAHEMIADLRLFARPPQPQREKTDLAALADRVIQEYAEAAAQAGVALRRRGAPGPVEAEVDPVQIAVALGALCRNALEALNGGGQVEIGLDAAPHEAILTVSDNGPGILPEHRLRLFDPFFSARQAGRGLGFGLSKCWRIVTAHGGRVEVQSTPGKGARFTMVLPR